jgi:uncharacterized membrane protein
MTPTREQILAASAGWVAVLLNLVPGVGNGYIYQRRWKAYWITVAVAVALLTTNAITNSRTKDQLQQVGVLGLLLLGPVTAVEAGLAVKRVRETS